MGEECSCDGEDMGVEQHPTLSPTLAPHPAPPLLQKKKQRKRKPRLPKGYNPELPNGGLPPPDPERWLPKWQRAEFKRRKVTSAQRKNEVVKGSQVRCLAQLMSDPDMSGTPQAVQDCVYGCLGSASQWLSRGCGRLREGRDCGRGVAGREGAGRLD